MKSSLVLLAFFAVSQAQALNLSSGESAQINGTQVTCGAASANAPKCHIIKISGDCLNVYIGNSSMTSCVTLKEAATTIEGLRAAGVCNN